MKKLYRKGLVHPSPQIKSQHQLSLLPAAILALTTLLSQDDREVLSYLISSAYANNPGFTVSSGTKKSKTGKKTEHPPVFNCDCFSCYMSYWIRWDSSPNRQLIHEIIEAFEDGLEKEKTVGFRNSKKERRKKKKNSGGGGGAVTSSGELTRSAVAPAAGGIGCGDEAEGEKGSVRKLMSFIGEKIFGAWG